jgi:hypothetical protein
VIRPERQAELVQAEKNDEGKTSDQAEEKE